MAAAIVALAGAAICSGQDAESLVVERKPIDLPAFDSVREIARYATASEYAEAVADPSYLYERLLYKSGDGAIVSGFLYAPNQRQAHKLPAIVFSRGSFIVNNRGPLLVAMMRRLARGASSVFCEEDAVAVYLRVGEREVVDRVAWARIAMVIAYKVDLYAYDEIWVGLFDQHGSELALVSEASGSFDSFVNGLPRWLPGCKSPEQWWNQVAHPAFLRNETTLYQRDSAVTGLENDSPS